MIEAPPLRTLPGHQPKKPSPVMILQTGCLQLSDPLHALCTNELLHVELVTAAGTAHATNPMIPRRRTARALHYVCGPCNTPPAIAVDSSVVEPRQQRPRDLGKHVFGKMGSAGVSIPAVSTMSTGA